MNFISCSKLKKVVVDNLQIINVNSNVVIETIQFKFCFNNDSHNICALNTHNSNMYIKWNHYIVNYGGKCSYKLFNGQVISFNDSNIIIDSRIDEYRIQ